MCVGIMLIIKEKKSSDLETKYQKEITMLSFV